MPTPPCSRWLCVNGTLPGSTLNGGFTVSQIYIAGIAMTVFGRHPERSLHDLASEALQGALKDARCKTGDLGVAFYSGMTNGTLQGQLSIPGQVIFARIGIEGIPVYNVENACASGSSAVNLAVQSLKAGTTDVALAIGAEKMNIPDKAKSFAIFEGGWDVSRVEEENGRRPAFQDDRNGLPFGRTRMG